MAEFLEKVGQRWDEFQNLHRFDNLYDFEKEYAKLAMELNREMLKDILGHVPKDHRKNKRITTVFGSVEMGHQNTLMPRCKGSRLSPCMREKTLYIGQEVILVELLLLIMMHVVGFSQLLNNQGCLVL